MQHILWHLIMAAAWMFCAFFLTCLQSLYFRESHKEVSVSLV